MFYVTTNRLILKTFFSLAIKISIGMYSDKV